LCRWMPLRTGLNLAGFIPLFGDGEKVGKNSVKVVLKYPTKAVELFKGLVKSGTLDVVPEAHLPGIIDTYLKGTTEKFIKNGVTGKDLLYITKKGKLDETLGVIKRSYGTIVWLEEGINKQLPNGKWTGYGWAHINDKHITGTIPGGSKFPDSMSPENVKLFIFTTIQNDQGLNQGVRTIYTRALPAPDGRICKIVVDDGKIITAYPIGSRTG